VTTFAETTTSLASNRRAFAWNVLNGALFGLSDTLMDINLVLVWFMSQLTSSNLLIGLLGPLASAGWFLPQLFLSGWTQQKPRKLVIYNAATGIRIVTWGVLVAVMWFVQDPVVLLALFYPIYIVMRLAGGLAGIPFLEVTAKTVPPRWRGRLFALRMITGGILSLAGSQIVSHVLQSDLVYPRSYALLVFYSLVVGGVAMLALAFVNEPAGLTRPATSFRAQAERGFAAVRTHHDYRYMLLARSFMLLGTIAFSFYTILAQQTLHAPARAGACKVCCAKMV